MPITKATPTIATRLNPADHLRLKKIAGAQGRKMSDVVREAIVQYLDQVESGNVIERERILEQRMKKFENRMASLMVRQATDSGVIFAFLWFKSDPETRKELFDKCFKFSTSRLRKKLPKVEEELKELMMTQSELEQTQ